MYKSNKEAGAAMGINSSSFGRLCRRYGIATPTQRAKERLRIVRAEKAKRDHDLGYQDELLEGLDYLAEVAA